MKIKNLLLAALFLVIYGQKITLAQIPEITAESGDTANYPYWIQMMKDPNANFFQTQRAFNLYWQGRTITKGCGWKPFKRWEWFMRSRINPDGSLPDPGATYKEYKAYINQKGNKSTYGDWQLLGPINRPSEAGIGRLNSIGFHPTDPDIIYVGSPSGGLWKTINGGQNWVSIANDIPTLGVSAIAVHPLNPNIIFIGTGDDDASDAPGLGVMVSTDGGNTWKPSNTGIEDRTISKILFFPDNPQNMIISTASGIYKSIDGGSTWQFKSGGNFTDICFKPFSNNVLYGSGVGNFYKSVNAGENWTKITNGILQGSRSVLGVSPANPEVVYVLTSNDKTFKAFYKSEDSGVSFTKKSDSPNIMGYQANGSDNGGQAFYDLCMTVDPKNANNVLVGGVNVFRSTNSGANWTCVGHWSGQGATYIHADQHTMSYSPLNGKLYVGNDGGFYCSPNNGTSWSDLSDGLAITQIYRLGQSATIKNLILTGYQDNGTAIYNNGNWSKVIGGDGMECLIDYSNPNYRYGELYYGDIRRTTNGGSNYSSIAGNGINGINEEGAWVTPFMLHRSQPKTMFVGYKNIWRTTNANAVTVSWAKITTAIPNPAPSNIVDVENSPANPEIFYYAREDNKMFRSDNITAATPTWVTLNNAPKVLITDIAAHPYDENIVYLTASNKKVYKSENKGTNWTVISSGLPSVSMNCIIYDKTSDGGVYVGTDMGIFYKDNTLTDWVFYSDGFPASTRITELEIFYNAANPSENRLRAATYGRGLWESELYTKPLLNGVDAELSNIILPGNQTAYTDVIGQIKVRNSGIQEMSSLNGSIYLNRTDTIPFTWTGSILSNKSVLIELPAFRVANGNHLIEVEIQQVNNIVDMNNENNTLSTSLEVNKAHLVRLNLITDNQGAETTWELKDSINAIIASGEPYSDGVSQLYTQKFTLGEGCYTFYIYDAGNNGICCSSGNGSYTLINVSTNTQIATGGIFVSEVSNPFCIAFDVVPVIDFIANQTSICSEAEVTFTSQCTGTISDFSWYFGSDATPASIMGQGPHIVSFGTGGFKDVILTVTTPSGKFSQHKMDYIAVKGIPEIVMQPENALLCEDDKLRLSVMAYGIDLNFQWKRDNVDIAGATTPIFEILNIKSADAGVYTCFISNSCQTVTSSGATVAVIPLPQVSVAANPEFICAGQSTELTASGADSYLWDHSLGSNPVVTVNPTNTTTYSITGTSNGCNSSRSVTVSIATAPTIQTQPMGVQSCLGTNVNFRVIVLGKYLKYQWKKEDIDIPGANQEMIYLDNITTNQAGQYKCYISSPCGSITSQEVPLTILPSPVSDFYYQVNGQSVTFTNMSEEAISYLWSFGDGNTSAEVNPIHNFINEGEYEVQLLSSNTCTTDTMIKTVIILGIHEIENKEVIQVIPNPNDGSFKVAINESSNSGYSLTLVDMQGKIVLKQTIERGSSTKEFKLNVKVKGLYKLILNTESTNIIKSVVVN